MRRIFNLPSSTGRPTPLAPPARPSPLQPNAVQILSQKDFHGLRSARLHSTRLDCAWAWLGFLSYFNFFVHFCFLLRAYLYFYLFFAHSNALSLYPPPLIILPPLLTFRFEPFSCALLLFLNFILCILYFYFFHY